MYVYICKPTKIFTILILKPNRHISKYKKESLYQLHYLVISHQGVNSKENKNTINTPFVSE